MEVNSPDSVILYCIIEEQIFYYALLNDDNQVVQSDGIVIDSKFNLFNYPQVIVDFLQKSFDAKIVSCAHMAVSTTDYTLIPEAIADEDTYHWLTHQFDKSANYHLDSIPGIKIGYHISTKLEDILTNHLTDLKIHHVISSNLSGKHKLDGIYSYPINEMQFIQLVNDQKTQYGQLKPSHTVLSRLYFSLLPYHLHQMDMRTMPLFTTHMTPEVLAELSDYVKEVKLLNMTLAAEDNSPLSVEQLYQIEKLVECES